LLIVLSAAVAVAYALWTVRSGVRLAVDTPTYSRWADLLIAADFNVITYLREQSFVASPVFYLLWIVVLALLKTVLGAWWTTGVVVLNWVALSIGAYMTLDVIRRVTQSGAGMLFAALLFLVAADLLIFVTYVLSDLMFWGLSTAVLTLGVTLATIENGDRSSTARTLAAGSVLVVLALLFRPVALPLVAFWVLAIATRLARPLMDRFGPALLAAAAGAAFLAIVAHAYVLMYPSAWPFGSLPDMLTMVAAEYREGMFVHNASPPMLVAPATDVFGFIRITLQKLLFFITPWLPHYSTAHTLLNLLFFLPAYGLSIAAITNLRRLAPPQQRAAVVLGLFVLFVSVFHAMLLIDSDHRYRVPVVPALIMLSAIGLEAARRPQTLASIARTKSPATARDRKA
jgi:hypothetical protein